MNRETIMTITKSVIIILILMAVVFALKAPAADLNAIPDEIKGDYVDSSGLPYFSEMDSYYNLRLTENYVDHGHVGDELKDGKEWDMHRYAPTGDAVYYETAIVKVTAWLHDFANSILGADYSVKEIAFWTGAIISTLAVIPAFIFARRLTNDWGAIVATLIIALAPNYFAHTFPGFFDTDMFYYICSLFFIFFFVECIRADKIIWKVVFAIFSMISLGVFAQAWGGYIFYVAVMGLFAVVYLIACYFFNVGDEQSNYSSKLQWFIHQKDVLSIILLAIIGFIGIGVFKGLDGALGIFGSVLNLLNLQSASVVVGGFPNVLISVAEMQMPALLAGGMNSIFLASTDGAINGIGGMFVFLAGLVVLYTLVRRAIKLRTARVSEPKSTSKKPRKSERKSSAKKLDDDRKLKISLGSFDFGSNEELLSSKRITVLYASLFLIWTITTILAVSRGSRFITTLVLPFGLMAGIFVGFAINYVKDKLDDDRKIIAVILILAFIAAVPLTTINMIYGVVLFAVIAGIGAFAVYGMKSNAASKGIPLKKYVVIIAIGLALITPSVCGAYQTSEHVVPGTGDPMWNAMTWIGETQPENTVITSWWDFGYLFEIAADRQVTFDGGSQSGERAFWLGQAMTTDNVELSAGIFRMLNTKGTLADEYLTNITGDTGKATDIIIDILPRTTDDAQKVLTSKYHLSADEAKQALEYTHPKYPRPTIFVASSDMLQKAGWWTYFGAWNFENQTSENYNYIVPTDQVEVKPGQTAKLTLSDAQGMKVNAVIQRGSGNNTTSAYTEALYSENDEQIMMNDTPYNPYNISDIMVIEDGMLVKNESVGNVKNANFTMFLMGTDNQYTPILMSNELRNSMFTQLFLFGGAGQDVFENVHTENGVMLFKVNYNNTAAGG